MKKSDLTDFIFFLSKPFYSRNEVLILISIVFFIIMLYSTSIDFLFNLKNNSLPQDYLYIRMYLNWIYLICGICVVYYARIIQNEEIEMINNRINDLLE